MSATNQLSRSKTVSFGQGRSKEEQSVIISDLVKKEFDIDIKPKLKNLFTGDAEISVRGKDVNIKGESANQPIHLKMRCISHIHPLDGLAIGVQKTHEVNK